MTAGPASGPILLEDYNNLNTWRTRPSFVFDEGRIIALSPVPPLSEWVEDGRSAEVEDGGMATINRFLRAAMGA